MAVTQLADGRWICYYRVRDSDGKSRVRKKYFGRGLDAEGAAYRRNEELALKKRRPVRIKTAPKFYELAETYTISRNFNQNSKKQLHIRLTATILPLLGNKTAAYINDADMDRYVLKRRRDGVKDSTICRENWYQKDKNRPHNILSWPPHKKVSNLMERRFEKSRNHPKAKTIRPASFLHHTRPGKWRRHQSTL